MHAKQANKMDPQLRMLLELTYEALIDAGVEPQNARNSRTGVFVGASGGESNEAHSNDVEEINGYSLVGGCRAMFSNRVSFAFDFKGKKTFHLPTSSIFRLKVNPLVTQ